MTPGGVPIDTHGHVVVSCLRSMDRDEAADVFERRWAAICAVRAARAASSHGEVGHACQRAADKLGIPIGTIYRWEDNCESDGQAALVPQRRSNEGRTSVPREIQRQIKRFWHSQLEPKPYQIAALADELCIARGIIPPSRYAVARWLKRQRLPKATETRLRKGNKAYGAKWQMRVRRNPEQLAVGELWCGDHRLADVMVRLTADPDAPVIRPMITAFIDVCSADYVGWSIREQPSSEGVAAALRRACLGFSETDLNGTEHAFPARGLPRECLIDNGKEFWGGAMRASLDYEPDEADFGADKKHCTALSQMGVRMVVAIPFTPQSKPIEAMFDAMAGIENLLPGYCGRNAKEKPEALRKQIDRGQLLTLAQYRQWFAGWVAKRARHHAIGPRRLVPAGYWAGHKPVLPDPAQLDDLMARDRWRTLDNKLLTLPGIGTYVPLPAFRDLYLDARGYKCRILYLRDDPAEIVLLHGGHRIVCRLLAEGDDWSMARGGEPGEQFREVAALNTLAREANRQCDAELKAGVQPVEIDVDHAWRSANGNVIAPAERGNGHRLRHRTQKLIAAQQAVAAADDRHSFWRDRGRQVAARDQAIAALGETQEPEDAHSEDA